jgi:hypothetical protein
MQEYLASGRAVRERTERLKALRLAKEATTPKDAEPIASARVRSMPKTETALKRTSPRRMKNQQPH